MDFIGNYTPRKQVNFQSSGLIDRERSQENLSTENVSEIADGIRGKTISNADILTMSIESSAKKRARTPLYEISNSTRIYCDNYNIKSSNTVDQASKTNKVLFDVSPTKTMIPEEHQESLVADYDNCDAAPFNDPMDYENETSASPKNSNCPSESHESSNITTESHSTENHPSTQAIIKSSSKQELRNLIQSKMKSCMENQLLITLMKGKYPEVSNVILLSDSLTVYQ
jgi:hypothetical protein